MAVTKRLKVLSHGRPPVSKNKDHMSSKQSRTIIRTHHRLQKEHAAAVKKGDTELAKRINEAIEKNGGLKTYQAASKQGQSKDRGGDSSKVLVEWLQQAEMLKPNPPIDKAEPPLHRDANHPAMPPKKRKNAPGNLNPPYRLLEIGALSTQNSISKFPEIIDVTRIDLNSQGPGIQQQDFMERPLPTSMDERFDVVSLSLVLNFVPDPVQRGEMLKRIPRFLRSEVPDTESRNPILPALFFVLPRPCVDNSRYLNEQSLLQVMANLGFVLTKKKKTAKLCYYLFHMMGEDNGIKTKKELIKDGPTMNNFCIVVK